MLIELCVSKFEIYTLVIPERSGIAVIPAAVEIYEIPVMVSGYGITRYDHVPYARLFEKELTCISIYTAVSAVLCQALICCFFTGEF